MQDLENAVAAPKPGGAGGKAAANAAAAAAAPTPRRALGELRTNAAALTFAAPLGAQQQHKQQTLQSHAPLQKPTGKPPVAPPPPQQLKKKATTSTVVTIQTVSAAAPSSSSLPQLPPVERPAGMTLDRQLAAEELRAQRRAHGAAQAICAGVPLSMPSVSRYSKAQSVARRLLGPAAAAAAARTFTVFDDDADDDDEEAECCRPSSAPSTPPAESNFLGEEQGKEKERGRRKERVFPLGGFSFFFFTSSFSPPPLPTQIHSKHTQRTNIRLCPLSALSRRRPRVSGAVRGQRRRRGGRRRRRSRLCSRGQRKRRGQRERGGRGRLGCLPSEGRRERMRNDNKTKRSVVSQEREERRGVGAFLGARVIRRNRTRNTARSGSLLPVQ